MNRDTWRRLFVLYLWLYLMVGAGLIQGFIRPNEKPCSWLAECGVPKPAEPCRALQSRSYFCCKPHCYVNDACLACTADARSELGSDPQMLTISPMLSTYVLSPPYICERASWPTIPCMSGWVTKDPSFHCDNDSAPEARLTLRSLLPVSGGPLSHGRSSRTARLTDLER